MDLQSIVITEIVSAVTVHSPKRRRDEMKNRPSYGLSLCMDGGRIVYTHKGEEYVEDRAHAVLLPMGETYSLRGEAEGYFPVINFKALYPVTDRIILLPVNNGEVLVKCFEALQRALSSEGNRAKAFSLLYEMLSELSAQKTPAVLAPALRYIYESYASPDIDNARLAARCNISEVYFRRLFHAAFGVSPKQYILSLRLQKAKRLLSEGRFKISAVARECGYESSAHFCRAFKAELGETPGAYRQKHQIYNI